MKLAPQLNGLVLQLIDPQLLQTLALERRR